MPLLSALTIRSALIAAMGRNHRGRLLLGGWSSSSDHVFSLRTRGVSTSGGGVATSSSSPQSFSRFSPTDHLYNMKPSLSANTSKEDDDEDEEDKKNVDEYFEDSIVGDVDPSLRIGKVLFKVGRSKSKTSIPHPEWFTIKRDEICSYRSTAQIRRCLKSWMVDYDRDYQKKFMSLPLTWRKDSPLNEKDTRATVVYGPEETVAYAHYFMGSRFSVMSVILSEVSNLLPNFRPKNIVDFGCGPGTAGAAAISVWPNKVEKYAGIDMSKSMLEAARVIIEGANQNVGCVLWDKMGDAVKRTELKHDRFDLGILAYTLSELPSDSAKKAAVQIVFEMLDVGGVLVIVEDGNPRGSHLVRTARQFLLDNFMSNEYVVSNVNAKRGESFDSDLQHVLRAPQGYSHEDVGAKTIAPCTHDKPCPLKNMFCSFSQRVRSSMIRKDNEEKYSYVIIQKVGKKEPPVSVTKKDKIKSVLTDVSNGTSASADNWLKPPNPDLDSFLITKEIGAKLKSLRHSRNKIANQSYLKALEEEESGAFDGSDDFVKNVEDNDEDDNYDDNEEIDESNNESGDEEHSDNSEEGSNSSNSDVEVLDEAIFEAEEEVDDEDGESGSGGGGDAGGITRTKINRRLHNKHGASISDLAISGEEASRLTTRNILKQYLKTSNKEDVLNLNDYLLEVIDWDEYKTPLYRKEWGRVIRSPIKKKGHVIVDSCTSSGFISRSTFSKGNLTHLPSLYTALRKTTWGGLFPSSVKFDAHESDESLLKLKNKSNPKPGTFKFSKDYSPPQMQGNADGSRQIKIDTKNDMLKKPSSSGAARTGGIKGRSAMYNNDSSNKDDSDEDEVVEEENFGRARRRPPVRGRSGFSISSLNNLEESDLDNLIGNNNSNNSRSNNSNPAAPIKKNSSKDSPIEDSSSGSSSGGSKGKGGRR